MRIIEPGDLKRTERLRRFACAECGCVFEASRYEYTVETDYQGTMVAVKCPCCHRTLYGGEAVE